MSKPTLSIGFDVPFEEAIAWGKSRVSVLSDEYYGKLAKEARSRAFTVSGLSSLDQVQGVLDSLNKALEKGDTFANWKKTLSPEVLALGNARLDNVFRTAIQTHYNIGRTQQQRENAAHRGYLMWDAINDGRTRPAHKAMDNYIAPIDAAIWKKWSAPAGYRCRCNRISLTEAQAKARGYRPDKLPPNAEPDKGWDYEKADDHDAALRKVAMDKLAKLNPALKGKGAEVLAGKPAFVEAKTIAEAGRIGTKIVEDQNIAWPTNPDGTPMVRFKHGRLTGSDAAQKLFEKATHTGHSNVETANFINKFVAESNALSDSIGIQRLRGINSSPGAGAAASMGDGVLSVAKTFDIKKAPQSKVSAWKLGDSGGPVEEWENRKPFNTMDYFSEAKDRISVTLWHEFGHHIHQTLKTTNVNYRNPPLETRLIELAKTRRVESPTRYSESNHKEYFAECYALFKMGRKDLVPNHMIDAITKIEKGEMP